jgi:hypothetical protein
MISNMRPQDMPMRKPHVRYIHPNTACAKRIIAKMMRYARFAEKDGRYWISPQMSEHVLRVHESSSTVVPFRPMINGEPSAAMPTISIIGNGQCN